VTKLGKIEKLRPNHELDGFNCGKDELNRFLIHHAWANQQAESVQTYVLATDRKVVGYYSLAAGAVSHDEATQRVKKGQARHPISVVLLARLAVDKTVQGRGVGPALLKDALVRTATAADTIGARALLVHAKDEQAKSFYEHFGFEPSSTDPLHLFLIMKDIKRRIRGVAR
jgi:GNAT superfamily N-acetyltransferase